MSHGQIATVIRDVVRADRHREAEILREVGRQRAVESHYAPWAGRVVPEEIRREHTARLSVLLAA